MYAFRRRSPQRIITDLYLFSDLQIQKRHGQAFLFESAVNLICGPCEQRMLITGLHEVCDISCSICGAVVGWKYIDAYEEDQKYKIGKFILEKALLSQDQRWTRLRRGASE